jgi:diguanylate cyclase (GGDEF)-like protein
MTQRVSNPDMKRSESAHRTGPETIPVTAVAPSTVMGTSDLPPKAVVTWLERTGVELLRLGWWLAVAVAAVVAGVVSAGLLALAGQVFTPVPPSGESTLAGAPMQAALLWVSGLMSAAVAAWGMGAWLSAVAALQVSREREDALSWVDDMTGVHNRRTFMEASEAEWSRARRYGTDAALLLVDADHFMQLNDRHGHLCGDELLRLIACAVQGSLRQADLLGRFGGAQFAVFLPHTELLGALDVAERVRNQVQAIQLGWLGHTVSTTVSVGVAPLRPELPTLDWMVHEAETALMAAKADGRNRVRALAFEEGQFDENQRSQAG